MTRAQLEVILKRRRGLLMNFVGFDYTTVDGTNADMADPIAVAIRQIGGSVADPTNPTSAEVVSATGTETAENHLAARAEIRLLRNIIGNWDQTKERAGLQDQDWAIRLKMLMQEAKELEASTDDEFGGVTSYTVRGGTIDLGFQQRGSDVVFN